MSSSSTSANGASYTQSFAPNYQNDFVLPRSSMPMGFFGIKDVIPFIATERHESIAKDTYWQRNDKCVDFLRNLAINSKLIESGISKDELKKFAIQLAIFQKVVADVENMTLKEPDEHSIQCWKKITHPEWFGTNGSPYFIQPHLSVCVKLNAGDTAYAFLNDPSTYPHANREEQPQPVPEAKQPPPHSKEVPRILPIIVPKYPIEIYGAHEARVDKMFPLSAVEDSEPFPCIEGVDERDVTQEQLEDEPCATCTDRWMDVSGKLRCRFFNGEPEEGQELVVEAKPAKKQAKGPTQQIGLDLKPTDADIHEPHDHYPCDHRSDMYCLLNGRCDRRTSIKLKQTPVTGEVIQGLPELFYPNFIAQNKGFVPAINRSVIPSFIKCWQDGCNTRMVVCCFPYYVCEHGHIVHYLTGQRWNSGVTSEAPLPSGSAFSHMLQTEYNMVHDEELKATIIDERTATLEDSTRLRITPKGQKTVGELVFKGDFIKTNYDRDETPRKVVSVDQYETYGLPIFSITIADYDAVPNADGGYRENDLGFINECVAQDGRILKLFESNGDEVTVVKQCHQSPIFNAPAPKKPAEKTADKPVLAPVTQQKKLVQQSLF